MGEETKAEEDKVWQYQHIRMISERSYGTEDWSNDEFASQE